MYTGEHIDAVLLRASRAMLIISDRIQDNFLYLERDIYDELRFKQRDIYVLWKCLTDAKNYRDDYDTYDALINVLADKCADVDSYNPNYTTLNPNYQNISGNTPNPHPSDFVTLEEVQELIDGSLEPINADLNNKVDKNSAIIAATKAKITYDAKGLVIAGADLEASDIPDLPVSNITGLQDSLSKLTEIDRNIIIPGNLKNKIKENIFGEKTVNILGDSMSHGANAPDIPNDSYVGILKKFFNLDFNSSSYGFTNMVYSISNTVGTFTEIHTISGDWTQFWDNAYLGSSSYITNTLNAVMTITVSQPFEYFSLYYVKQLSGGKFEVSVDGVVRDTIDFSGSQLITRTALIAGNPNAPFTITLKKLDTFATAVVCGVSYYNATDDVIVNNYSRSGVRLANLPNEVLDYMCDTKLAIFSLGHNDSGDPSVTIEAFQEKLDYCKAKFLANETTVLVNDFIWDLETNVFKQALKQFAEDVHGIYVNHLEDTFRASPSTIQSEGYINDPSHPSILGHQILAEKMAKVLQLGTTSKDVIEKTGKNYLPLDGGESVTGSVNLATLSGNVGVGTASPSSKFEVSGTLSDETSRIGIVNTQGGNVTLTAGVSGQTNGGLDIGFAGVSKMVVSATGNVLIGTTTNDGTNKLQVAGSIKSDGIDIYTSDLSGSYTARTKIDKGYADATYVKKAEDSPVAPNSLWVGSQAEYDAIVTPDANTIYFIQ